MIRNSGIEPQLNFYLETPPTRGKLLGLIAQMDIGVPSLPPEKGTPHAELGLDDLSLSNDHLIDAMLAHPILIKRPIIVTSIGTSLCRPSEAVLAMLPNPQRSRFTKEDGELVVDPRTQHG